MALDPNRLRPFWYPVLTLDQLMDTPIAVELLGEPLVIWRGADGAPHAAPDRCPHRSARLSGGSIGTEAASSARTTDGNSLRTVPAGRFRSNRSDRSRRPAACTVTRPRPATAACGCVWRIRLCWRSRVSRRRMTRPSDGLTDSGSFGTAHPSG